MTNIDAESVLDAALDKMLDECLMVWEITTREEDEPEELERWDGQS